MLPIVGLVVGNTGAYSVKASDVFVNAGVVGVTVKVPVPVLVAVEVAVTVVVTVTVAVWLIFLQHGVLIVIFIMLHYCRDFCGCDLIHALVS